MTKILIGLPIASAGYGNFSLCFSTQHALLTSPTFDLLFHLLNLCLRLFYLFVVEKEEMSVLVPSCLLLEQGSVVLALVQETEQHGLCSCWKTACSLNCFLLPLI